MKRNNTSNNDKNKSLTKDDKEGVLRTIISKKPLSFLPGAKLFSLNKSDLSRKNDTELATSLGQSRPNIKEKISKRNISNLDSGNTPLSIPI